MYDETLSSILIVDDNSQNLQVLADILKEKYKVATVKDGFKALHFVIKKKPDLILLDIMMPEIDGFEVCRRLKINENTREIPVIFISALADIRDKIKGFEAGGVDYITKPFKKEEVFARVNVHLKLKHTQEELKTVNATKDKLFSIIAHNLRGPIGSLSSALDMITEDPDALDTNEKNLFFCNLNTSVKSAYQLLENLLHWARSQRKGIEYKPLPLKIGKIISMSIEPLCSMAKNKNISLCSQVNDSITAYADENMIMVVIQNLISNALKFTPESGSIVVDAAIRDNEVEIWVQDTGIGISDDNQEKLFHIDKHFTTYGTQNEKGSGLGLLICKEFIEQNKGKIWVKSLEGRGTSVTFSLPVKALN